MNPVVSWNLKLGTSNPLQELCDRCGIGEGCRRDIFDLCTHNLNNLRKRMKAYDILVMIYNQFNILAKFMTVKEAERRKDL